MCISDEMPTMPWAHLRLAGRTRCLWLHWRRMTLIDCQSYAQFLYYIRESSHSSSSAIVCFVCCERYQRRWLASTMIRLNWIAFPFLTAFRSSAQMLGAHPIEAESGLAFALQGCRADFIDKPLLHGVVFRDETSASTRKPHDCVDESDQKQWQCMSACVRSYEHLLTVIEDALNLWRTRAHSPRRQDVRRPLHAAHLEHRDGHCVSPL